VVDHDHVTGKIRGLLCFECNSAIGLHKDDPARMEAAAMYARQHRGDAVDCSPSEAQ
jgi:hypothetical protein